MNMTFGHGVFDSFGADTLTFAASTNYGPATISVSYHNNAGQHKAGVRRYNVSGKFHTARQIGNKTYPAGEPFSYGRDSLAAAKAAANSTTSGKYKITEVWEGDLDAAWPASGPRDANTSPQLKVFTITNGNKVAAQVPAEVSSWSAWSEWSECSSCKQRRSRSRTITRRAFGSAGGVVLEEDEEKECGRVDEVLSDWSDWGVCTDGKQTRTRSVVTAADCGGSFTQPDTHTETQDCTVETIDDGDDGDDSTTDDGTTDTTITAQSTTVTPVAASSGMSDTMKGLLVVGVLGGGFLYMKRKKGKKPIA